MNLSQRVVSTATEGDHLIRLMASKTHGLRVYSVRVEPALVVAVVRLTDREGTEGTEVMAMPFWVPAGTANGMAVRVVAPRPGEATVSVSYERLAVTE